MIYALRTPLLPSRSPETPEPKHQSIEQWLELTWAQKPTAKSRLQWTSVCQATNMQEGLHKCLGPPLRPNRGLTAHPGPTQKEEPTIQSKGQQTDPKLRKDTSHNNQGTGAHPQKHRTTQPFLHPKQSKRCPTPEAPGSQEGPRTHTMQTIMCRETEQGIEMGRKLNGTSLRKRTGKMEVKQNT